MTLPESFSLSDPLTFLSNTEMHGAEILKKCHGQVAPQTAFFSSLFLVAFFLPPGALSSIINRTLINDLAKNIVKAVQTERL